MNIAIYTLTSELHDTEAVNKVTNEFLGSLQLDYDFKDDDYSDYGCHPLDLIYVRTGGTEGIFKRLLSQLQAKSSRPFYLLTSGKSNSLAASMEILSFLHQQGFQGEIVHGDAAQITRRVQLLEKVAVAKTQIKGCRLGIIGTPSDWLISSYANKQTFRQRLGIELIDVPMQKLMNAYEDVNGNENGDMNGSRNVNGNINLNVSENVKVNDYGKVRDALPGAINIYKALKVIVEKYELQGFTIRCFDLLTAVHNTGCLALAQLNSEGIVAGCEGDVTAMLTMKIAQSLIGVSGFQANPASINPETGEMLFAHCTIPFNMVSRYEFDTHYESGIGVGIRGYMEEGPVTIFKVSGDLSRHFIAEGELLRNQAKPDLCRTQQVIRLSDPSQTAYFLTNPIGNHHIILPGHHRHLIEAFMTL